jgi:hypothetical protein
MSLRLVPAKKSSPLTLEERHFAELGLVAISAYLGVFLATRWEWSFLMDDVTYLGYMPKAQNLLTAFISEFRMYWGDGRFYPIKYIANLLKFRYLPLEPNVFHAFNMLHLFVILALACVSLKNYFPPMYAPAGGCLFVIGFGLLQRPLLDIVALNTIAEGWVILFLAWGLILWPRRPVAYRLIFLFCSLSKEPAVAVWLASAMVYGICYLYDRPRQKTWLVHAALDMAVFVDLALIMKNAQLSGSYTVFYHLWNRQHLPLLALGTLKCLIGILPALSLMVLDQPKRSLNWEGYGPAGRFRLFNGMFAVIYLFLVIGRGSVAGFQLIPPAFSLFLIAASYVLEMVIHPIPDRVWAVFATTFVVVFASSLVRYNRYVCGINESARAYQDLLLTKTPRLIIFNGEEAADLGQQLADQMHAPVKTMVYENDSKTLREIHHFHGDVILFELSNYFGHYSPITIEALGTAAGGWSHIIDRKVCRIFFNQTPL